MAAFSFTRFKDRIWGGFDTGLRRLPHAPDWVQSLAYGSFGGFLTATYALPGAPIRPTARNFAKVIGRTDPFALHQGFARNMARGMTRMEMLRSGRASDLGALLDIADAEHLDDAMAGGRGAVLVMPHCHASVAMVRGLAERYPVLMLVRESQKPSRADAQRSYYEHLGCPCLDVRRTPEAKVARAVLKALREGHLVVGVIDRIQDAPPEAEPYDKSRDIVRVLAFGQPVGMAGWPVRFAGKIGAPVIPGMVTQTDTAIRLRLSAPVRPDDVLTSTQSLWRSLETMLRQYPEDWLFLYDKHWTRALARAAAHEH